MPASLYPTSNPAATASSLSLGNLDLIMMDNNTSSVSNGHNNHNGFVNDSVSNGLDSRAAAEQIAMQLALLQQQHTGHEVSHTPVSSSANGVHGGSSIHGSLGHNLNGGHLSSGIISSGMNGMNSADLLNGHGASGSLEDLKNTQRRSQNMTECVPVPSSEHVAEIVGRQGKPKT